MLLLDWLKPLKYFRVVVPWLVALRDEQHSNCFTIGQASGARARDLYLWAQQIVETYREEYQEGLI